MKRLISILVVALFLLTACAGQVPVTQPESSEAAPSQQVSSIAYEESSQEASSNKAPTEEDYARAAAERIQSITINDLTTAYMLERLKKMGITVSVENIKQLDKINLSFNLCIITGAGVSLSLPINAPCGYDTFENPASYGGDVIGNFKVVWGGISLVDENTIAVSTLEDIFFYNTDTLKEQPLKLDLSSFKGKEFYLLGAIRDKTDGIVVPIFLNGTDGFAFFNEDGQLNRIETFEYGQPKNRWFYSTVNPASVGHDQVNYQDKLEIIKLDDTYLIFTNTSHERDEIYYNISEKHILGQAYPLFDARDGNRRIVLNNFDLWFGNFANITGEKSRLALYYENDEFRSGFFFDGKDISRSYGNPNIMDYPGLQNQWNPTKPIVSAACGFSDLTITLDFERKTFKLDYKIKPEHLEEAFATSPDGRYSLHTASSDGAGDIGFANIILKDNKSGILRFIALSGGMYGGYGNTGFFSNGEIYVLETDSLMIYSPDPAVPSPLLTFALPLGALEKERVNRYLLTFRRDPTTKNFIILYADKPFGSLENMQVFPFEHVCNYRVGFCDSKGNLLESYDTGQPLLEDQFGFLNMSFHLSGDELTITGIGGKGYTGVQGVFNLKTHTYTNTLKKDDNSKN